MLLDVTRLLARMMSDRLPTGIDRVILEYVRYYQGTEAYAAVSYGGKLVVLSRRDSVKLFDALLSPQGSFKKLVRWLVGKSYPLSMSNRFAKNRLFFNLGHSGLDDPSYFKRLARSGLAPIFFIHDLIPITHPEYCRPGESLRHRARIETALRLGKGVIVNSQATLEDMVFFANSLDLPLPPSVVAPLAPAALPEPDAKSPLDAPYFVMLGTIEPRKNHWLMLQIWRQLIGILGEATPRLLVIGQRGWECENVVDLLDRCDALKGFVYEYPKCSDHELSTFLYHARALLFPSFAEGYGMPLVEALSLGTPVICSELPVFREIAGDVFEYAHPLDGRRWEELVVEYANPESACRLAQRQRILGCQAPEWNMHFSMVDALLSELNGKNARL